MHCRWPAPSRLASRSPSEPPRRFWLELDRFSVTAELPKFQKVMDSLAEYGFSAAGAPNERLDVPSSVIAMSFVSTALRG